MTTDLSGSSSSFSLSEELELLEELLEDELLSCKWSFIYNFNVKHISFNIEV